MSPRQPEQPLFLYTTPSPSGCYDSVGRNLELCQPPPPWEPFPAYCYGHQKHPSGQDRHSSFISCHTIGTRLESLSKARLRDGVQVGERNDRNVTTVDREMHMLTRLSGCCCSLSPRAGPAEAVSGLRSSVVIGRFASQWSQLSTCMGACAPLFGSVTFLCYSGPGADSWRGILPVCGVMTLMGHDT